MNTVAAAVLFAMQVLMHAPAAAAQVGSGASSDGLIIAVDPATHRITGYFSSATGYDEDTGAPRFSCTFFLAERADGTPPYRIDTWFPGGGADAPSIAGSLRFEGAGEGAQRTVTIALDEEHGGCANVQHFADAGGAAFELDRPGAWSAVRVISARRAYFHAKPEAAAKGRAYVTAGDPVVVLATRPGWVRVEYRRDDAQATTGWLLASALFPEHRAPGAAAR